MKFGNVDELLPCPFCASLDIDECAIQDSNGRDTGPTCLNCYSTAKSIEIWNKRSNKN